jgi:hypothetical protein
MNQSEKVNELRKQIRDMDALLARCARPTGSIDADLYALYRSAQAFLKDCILLEDGFKKPAPAPELPEFAPLENSNPAEQSQSKQEAVPQISNAPIADSSAEKAGELNQVDHSETDHNSTQKEQASNVEYQPQKIENKEEKKVKPQQNSGVNQRLADKIHRGQVKNLKKALALHETYRYINELFHGNADLFHSTMEDLEQSGSISAASSLLKQVEEQQQWDSDHPLLEQLNELIEKRFTE